MVSFPLQVKTTKPKQVVDITDTIAEKVQQSDVTDGLCSLFVLHTTASITTADLDPGTDLDMLDLLEALVPDISFRHPHNPAHVPDHIFSSLIGPSLTIPVNDKKLVLGTWQRVVLVELDGPRERDVMVTVWSDEG
jgi:secondary thiamine-phosphate synthase enzyme